MPWIHLKTLGALATLAVQVACLPDFNDHCEMDQVGTSWCEGKTVFNCVEPVAFERQPIVLRDYCSENGDTCQMVTSQGRTFAACVTPDEHCEAGQSQCRDGWVLRCLDGFWERVRECAALSGGMQCVEDPAQGAQCMPPSSQTAP